MSAFVNTLRARPTAIVLGGADAMTVRVQLYDAWDAVKIEAGAATTLGAVKGAALAVLGHPSDLAADFVMKLRGHDLLSDQMTLADAGARDGSTIILVRRHRRPVR